MPFLGKTPMNELDDLMHTATAAEIREVLDFLLNECSLDQMPQPSEVQNWQQILQQRGGKFARIATDLCQTFLAEHHEK